MLEQHLPILFIITFQIETFIKVNLLSLGLRSTSRMFQFFFFFFCFCNEGLVSVTRSLITAAVGVAPDLICEGHTCTGVDLITVTSIPTQK